MGMLLLVSVVTAVGVFVLVGQPEKSLGMQGSVSTS